MARISAHGTIDVEYFSLKKRCLIRYMSDGTILRHTPFGGGWKVGGTRKKTCGEQEWQALLDRLRSGIAKRPEWLQNIRNLPTFDALQRMANDGIAKAPDDCQVEPDGRCPHGAPSWLLLFGLI